MNLSEYLLENVNSFNIINEAVNIKDIDKAIDRIEGYLYEKKIYPYPYQLPFTKDGKKKFGVLAWTDKNTGVCFCWDVADTASIESILFTSNFDETLCNWSMEKPTRWDVSLECKGASMVRLVKLVDDVLNGRTPMKPKAVLDAIKDAQIWEDKTEEILNMVNEAEDPAAVERERARLYQKIRNMKKKGLDTKDLDWQYTNILDRLRAAKLAAKGNVITKPQTDGDIQKLQDTFEDEVRVAPEERFEDMKSYIQKVIIGFKPLAVICGAPGVGKTYRIMQDVKSFGKVKDRDYKLIKGKSSAAQLYMDFHDYSKPGQLIIIDDADEVVKDPVAINLIKAACDSSDERWVSYGTARPPEMPEDIAAESDDAVLASNGKYYYPKEFLMESGVIIITNMNAGALDTAIKNRALLCDLNFTTSEILDIVRSIAPKIMPNILTEAAKTKALNYLQELADKEVPMEISIRSFTLVAGLYLDQAPEEAIQRRIREQMKLQFSRNKTKY